MKPRFLICIVSCFTVAFVQGATASEVEVQKTPVEIQWRLNPQKYELEINLKRSWEAILEEEKVSWAAILEKQAGAKAWRVVARVAFSDWVKDPSRSLSERLDSGKWDQSRYQQRFLSNDTTLQKWLDNFIPPKDFETLIRRAWGEVRKKDERREQENQASLAKARAAEAVILQRFDDVREKCEVPVKISVWGPKAEELTQKLVVSGVEEGLELLRGGVPQGFECTTEEQVDEKTSIAVQCFAYCHWLKDNSVSLSAYLSIYEMLRSTLRYRIALGDPGLLLFIKNSLSMNIFGCIKEELDEKSEKSVIEKSLNDVTEPRSAESGMQQGLQAARQRAQREEKKRIETVRAAMEQDPNFIIKDFNELFRKKREEEKECDKLRREAAAASGAEESPELFEGRVSKYVTSITEEHVVVKTSIAVQCLAYHQWLKDKSVSLSAHLRIYEILRSTLSEKIARGDPGLLLFIKTSLSLNMLERIKEELRIEAEQSVKQSTIPDGISDSGIGLSDSGNSTSSVNSQKDQKY